jgi:hypothetical protein
MKVTYQCGCMELNEVDIPKDQATLVKGIHCKRCGKKTTQVKK